MCNRGRSRRGLRRLEEPPFWVMLAQVYERKLVGLQLLVTPVIEVWFDLSGKCVMSSAISTGMMRAALRGPGGSDCGA